MTNTGGLVWEDKYSVHIDEIDDQHKKMFEIINQLIEVINTNPDKKTITAIIGKIVAYKAEHFATEEKYFHQFNFEGTAEHEAAHHRFDQKVKDIQAKHGDDVVAFAFELVDFLEDWLIGHLMGMDQKYVECFESHGLH